MWRSGLFISQFRVTNIVNYNKNTNIIPGMAFRTSTLRAEPVEQRAQHFGAASFLQTV